MELNKFAELNSRQLWNHLKNNEKLPKNLLKTRKKTWNFVSPAKCEPYISAN